MHTTAGSWAMSAASVPTTFLQAACWLFTASAADAELLARTNVLHYYQKRLHVYVYQVRPPDGCLVDSL